MQQGVNITFSKNHILVLSDLLYRINSQKSLDDVYVDQAEQRALWDLESIIEKNCAEIISWDYLQALRDARNELRDKE